MSDQPHYPYRDGDRAVLGPEVIATADGMTIRWKGAKYRRDHGEHVGAATPLICSDERHAAKVAALQAELDRYEEVVGELNETLVDRAKQAARAEAERDQIREDLGAALGRADADRASLTEVRMRERARQAAIERVRALADDMRGSPDTRWLADQLTGALDGAPSAPATTRYIHVTITNRDEYTANRAALSLVDWIHAEFPGLQVATDAREWTAPAATQATDGPVCGAEPPARADDPNTQWGDCWCTLPPGHDGDHRCQPCTDRHGAPGWPDQPAATDGPACRYCGADCSNGRSWDGGDLYACGPCANDRAAINRAGSDFDALIQRARDRHVTEEHAEPDELTADESRNLVDELGLDLYRAQDALAFVEECCTIADREQKPITTADVREWLKGARCGRQLAADAAAAADQPEPATVTDPEYLRQQCTAVIRRWWDADDGGAEEIADAVMRVHDRHLQQLRQRLRLADELLATRDAELAAAKKTARGIGAWGVLQAIEQALPQGPTVAEAAADDARHWNDKYAGEGQ